MSSLRKILHLPARRRRLLARALCTVAVVRVALLLLPFRLLRDLPARVRPARRGREATAGEIARAVGTAARFVPKATCLTQALAAQMLLRRAGLTGRLRIGARRDESGAFDSHAWLEYEGKAIIGGAGSDRFVPLWELDPKSP